MKSTKQNGTKKKTGVGQNGGLFTLAKRIQEVVSPKESNGWDGQSTLLIPQESFSSSAPCLGFLVSLLGSFSLPEQDKSSNDSMQRILFRPDGASVKPLMTNVQKKKKEHFP
jgi:hypothetical protein